MTDDNKKKNIASEVRRGDESLDSAQILLDACKHADAVSRAPGVLGPDVAKLFSRLQKFRLDADYTAEFVFSAEGVRDEVAAARSFVDAARRLLQSGGWIDAAQ